MSSFTFKQIILDQHVPLQKNLLWIWHADKIPPHIGFSSYGHYFSLKVSGKDSALSTNRVFGLAGIKSIPLICIVLNHDLSFDKIEAVFESYTHAIIGESTCLTPITEILGLEEVNQLSELLHKLTENNTLGSTYGMNLPNGYNSLPDYSPVDIQTRLKLLANAPRKADIS